MSKYPSQMQDKFNLRFPDGMRDAIADRAKANGRSMNSEIIQILEDALQAKTSDAIGEAVSFIDSKGNENHLPIDTIREVLIYAADVLRKYEDKKPT